MVEENAPATHGPEVQVEDGMLLVDTGCKKAVAGQDWHHTLRETMDDLSQTYQCFPVDEWLQFGTGSALNVVQCWLYKVGNNGRRDTFRVGEIRVAGLPGLSGPEDFAQAIP